MAQTLSIDASTLSTRFNMLTFFETFFAGFDDASQDFYGGTPDSAYGGTYYMNGSQVLSTLSSGGTESASVVLMEGAGLAYDFIHHGAAFGHGVSGAVDSLVFGTWVTGQSSGTQGNGAAGEVTGLDEGVIIDGFDISVAPGAGNDTATNLTYAVYSAIGTLDADALFDLISDYSVEVIGTRRNDKLVGFDGDDVLIGGGCDDTFLLSAGDDVLIGGSGNDTLRGGAGADTLIGGNGDDMLYGGQSADVLKGGAGDDVLSGKKGADELTGGAGADTFVIASNAKLDIITDFVGGEDLIDVTALGLSSLTDFEVRENDSWVQLISDDVRIRLIGHEFADLTDDMFAF
ncbi:calcium-binding protein [Pseudooceanicola sp.]|uniref:calcium-binding protein n=1 Tax=Pseudooceanicola sp. TaxID=1914328 RepID=UPI0035120819